MPQKADVLVVGAGPAGCSAAIHLRRAGARVLLIDRCKFPRRKVCGGMLTPKAVTLAEEVLAQPLSARTGVHSSRTYEIRKLQKPLRKINDGTPMHTVDRERFDAVLLEAVRSERIEIGEKAAFRSLPVRGGVAELADGREVSFDFLIGADGIKSSVGRSIGKTLDRRLVAPALQTELPTALAQRAGIAEGHRVFLGYVGYGWGWSFEKPGHVTLGIAGLGLKGGELRARFLKFLTDLGISPEAEGLKIVGATVPFGSYMENPARGNVLLVGDAAGFAEPITGEGIQFALLSGKLAAEAIAGGSKNPAEKYASLCSSMILPELKEAKHFRPLIFSKLLQPVAVNLLLKNERCMAGFIKAVAGETGYGRAVIGALSGGG